MADHATLVAALLGLLEGLTEFIRFVHRPPAAGQHFLGFQSAGRAFEVVIQLGAVLAILTVYAGKLSNVARAAPRDPAARRFILSVLVAFLPAVVIGVLAHDFIKTVLFETPMLVAVMLILGGVVLLFVDRLAAHPVHDDAMRLPLGMALKIGLFQCLAMVPGVSRSGATIVGALWLGADRRTAAEFSFFLSMPTMAGAFAYDLFLNRAVLDGAAVNQILVGFAVAFVSAVVVVKGLLWYLSRHGFALFGWWRIIVGSAALAALLAGY